MDDLEDIRRRKLQELQERQAAAQSQQAQEEERAAQQAEAQEAAIERLLQQILDPEARERLTRIRMSRPEFHDTVVRQLVGLAQSGRLQRRLTDEDMRQILAQLSPKDRDISITRK